MLLSRYNPLFHGPQGLVCCGLFDRSSSSNTTNLNQLYETLTEQTDQSGNSGFNFSNVAGGLALSQSQSDALTLSSSDSHNYNDQSSVALSSADSHNVSDASVRSFSDSHNDSSSLSLSSVDSHADSSVRSFSDSRTFSDSRSYSTVATDQGAVAAGLALGQAGINAASGSLAKYAELASSSVTALGAANANALDVLAGLATQSIDASRTQARDAASDNAAFLNTAVSAFGSLATRNSASADDRIVKIVGFALLAVAAAVVLPGAFKGGKVAFA